MRGSSVFWNQLLFVSSLAAGGAAGLISCSSAQSQQDENLGVAREAILGDALPGTNSATFAAAKANFQQAEGAPDGLGPIFNAHSCAECHQASAHIGGAGENIERRYGKLTKGLFDAMENTGGSLRQLFGLETYTVNGLNCQSGTDANPAPGATIFAGRVTTPLFGLGLVDSLPDSAFDTLASREPAAIQGIVNRVSIALANPFDSSQVVGGTRVGRFGWKAGVHDGQGAAAAAAFNQLTSAQKNDMDNFLGTL